MAGLTTRPRRQSAVGHRPRRGLRQDSDVALGMGDACQTLPSWTRLSEHIQAAHRVDRVDQTVADDWIAEHLDRIASHPGTRCVLYGLRYVVT